MPAKVIVRALSLWFCACGLALGQTVPPDVELIRDVPYCSGGGRQLRLLILRPKSPPAGRMPALVWIHGGGWATGSRDSGISDRMVRFVRKGYVGISIEYRLTTEAVFPAQIEDCKCAIRFLRANADIYQIDPGRIGVWGPSAGGHLAALLGTSGDVADLEGNGGWAGWSSRVQAVCDWYAPTDLLTLGGIHDLPFSAESLLLGGPVQQNREKALRASPAAYVTSDDAPFWIMHGDRDPLVPFRQSELLHGLLLKAGVQSALVRLAGALHGGPQFESEASLSGIEAFFDLYLSYPKPRRRP
jgi:acetyl esterase/lipase